MARVQQQFNRRRALQWAGWLAVGVTLAAIGAVVYGLRTAPQVAPGARPPPPVAHSGVKTLFLGTSSMAWTDGNTTWMVDGFFSRQALGRVVFSRLDVDEQRVLEVARETFSRLEMPEVLSGIVVAHSHYDHAMDAPFLVKTYGGKLTGSESTTQIALGQDVPASSLQVTGKQAVASFGQFQVELRESAHAPTGFTGGFNASPLRLPAHALSFKEGISYSFLVSHPRLGGRPFALIQPSAGFIPGQNRGVAVDTVFLGTGGLGKLDSSYVADYWQEMVLNTGAEQVFLIHWDNFTLPLMQHGVPVALQAMPNLVDDFSRSLDQLVRLGQRDGVTVQVLNAWDVVEFPKARLAD
jgi:L-ascorbate metabolism protein UlaG (beta-lactamase superfamily)